MARTVPGPGTRRLAGPYLNHLESRPGSFGPAALVPDDGYGPHRGKADGDTLAALATAGKHRDAHGRRRARFEQRPRAHPDGGGTAAGRGVVSGRAGRAPHDGNERPAWRRDGAAIAGFRA